MAKKVVKKPTANKAVSTKVNTSVGKQASGGGALKIGEGNAPKLPEGYVNTGLGHSDKTEDQQIPIISILQTLSPQLKKNKPEYIEGAEVGQFLFKNTIPPVFSGEEGFYFIPSLFKTMEYVEWVPRDSGGGYVGRHDKLPSDIKIQVDAKNKNKKKYIGKNGNEFIETRYVYGQAFDMELNPIGNYVIPFSSTGHSIWKTWNQNSKSKRLIDAKSGEDLGRAEPWMFIYKLTSKEQSNSAGDWYSISIEDIGWNDSEDLILIGKALYESVVSGEKVAAAEERGSGVGSSNDDGAM